MYSRCSVFVAAIASLEERRHWHQSFPKAWAGPLQNGASIFPLIDLILRQGVIFLINTNIFGDFLPVPALFHSLAELAVTC